MKRLRRAGVVGLAATAILAAAWILPPVVHRAEHLCPVRPDGVQEASAYAAFARRYGVSCSVCHASYPQLNAVGFKFRTAGYRMPDEIGADAKWANWGDNTSVKVKESFKAVSTKGHSATATNGFSSGGVEWFPWEGAIGKYVAVNSEVDFDQVPASVGVSNLNLDAAFPVSADSFVTTRVGLMSAFQGYGASDRGVGGLSPTFLPTPSQVQPGYTPANKAKTFTYPGFNRSGEGVEVAYNWKGTHASVQLTNGYDPSSKSGTQGEVNHFKDLNLFVNQMLPNDCAIAAAFSYGTVGYSSAAVMSNPTTPYNAAWFDHYLRGVVYATVKVLKADKLDVLAGMADGEDQVQDAATQSASHRFHSLGWFTTLQSVQPVLGQSLTSALSYGTNRASTSTGGNRVSDVTLSFAVPVENNKFDLSFQTRRSQNGGGVLDTITNTAQAQWELMF
jgi:hypothetical protein